MKNIFLSILMLGFTVANCQVEKGRSMIDGNLYLNNTNNDNNIMQGPSAFTSKASGLNVGVNYGYFIKNKFMLGVFIGYGSTKNTSRTIGNSTNGYTDGYSKSLGESYTGGLFVRKYFMLYKDKLALIINANLGYNFGYAGYTYYLNNTYSQSRLENTGIRFSLNPGLVYFISRKWTVGTSFNFLNYVYGINKRYESGKLINNSNESNLSVNPNFSLNSFAFSFSYYFGKPKEAKTVDKGTEK